MKVTKSYLRQIINEELQEMYVDRAERDAEINAGLRDERPVPQANQSVLEKNKMAYEEAKKNFIAAYQSATPEKKNAYADQLDSALGRIKRTDVLIKKPSLTKYEAMNIGYAAEELRSMKRTLEFAQR